MRTIQQAQIAATTEIDEHIRLVNVCFHVVRPARYDVRATRAARALARVGYAVSIIDVEEEQQPAREMVQDVLLRHIHVSGWHRSRHFEPLFFLKALRTFLLSIRLLLRANADIYHACEITALPASYLAARLRHRPLIFEAYELPLQDVPLAEMGRLRRVFQRFLALLLARVIPACAAVITVSPPIVAEIKQRYHNPNVALVRNILPYRAVARTDRLREHLGLAPHVSIALYQGNLQPDRGLDALVRAAPLLAPDIVIVMMGKGVGATRDCLESLIRAQGAADRVKIIPPVLYEELLDWTASADIGLTLIPLDYTLNMKFCLPNKLFEYIMAGLPVLSAPLEAITEIIARYGVGRVVPSLSPADVARGINMLLADRAALDRMRENALRAARELCWEQESQRLQEVYKNIVVR